MINVPIEFRPHHPFPYPPNNVQTFEEWLSTQHIPESERTYLPVFWTSYYCKHKYGKDARKMRDLQAYINCLDKNKKYFTVCQYDDSIINSLNHIDIKIYGMGGGRIDSPLPLICQPHPYEFNVGRTVFASFLGANNHPIRREVLALKSNDYQVSSAKVDIKQYCELMAKSIFSLCPRGYGASSFRICEALQYGSIPIYISDQFIIPFGLDFNEFGVLIKQGEDINKVLRDIPLCEIKKKQEAGKRIYQEYYTYEGCYKNLIKSL